MAKSTRKPLASALKFSSSRASRSVVRHQYAAYRRQAQLPVRCDMPECQFHTQPMIWNGKPLPVILDHRSGVSRDDRTKNLRYLCPNCDAQQENTRGGRNKGRVRNLSEAGYTVAERDGSFHFTLIAEPHALQFTGHAPTVRTGPVVKGHL